MAKGGTEKHVLTLLRGLQHNYRIVLLAPRGEILDEFLKFDIRYVEFPLLQGNVIKKIKVFKKRLSEINSEYLVDIVHIHAAHEFVRFTRKVLPQVPIIFHLSAHQGTNVSKAFNYWLSARISKKHADLLIAVSEEEKRIVTGKGFPAEKVRVVYNGYEQSEGDDQVQIDEIKKKYNLDGSMIIGNLGRLNKTKRLDVLIRAFGMLKKGGAEELKLLLVGDGPARARLERIVQREGLEQDVCFTGFIPRGDRIIGIFDIFVLPTTYEGCSNVLVEVMAKGLPIITTDIPSVNWMFEKGTSALLFRQNRVSDLYKKLDALVRDQGLRASLGENARNRFTDAFKASQMIQKTDEIYRDLL
jgi:glycosyltransferase involved in cell wall biosynthesis